MADNPTSETPDAEDPKHGNQSGEQKISEKTEQKRPGKLPLIILAVVVIILAIGAAIYFFITRNEVSTDDAYTDGRAITIAPKISGYVVQLLVDDNSYVHAGDILLKIDQRDYESARARAAAALDLAKAQLQSAEINYRMAQVTYPARLQQAQAQRDSAFASRLQALRQFWRQRDVDPRATSGQDVDQATAQSTAANANLAFNDAAVSIAKLVPENIAQAQAQVTQLQAQVEQARAQLVQANLDLSYTSVTAPQNGWVTRRDVEMGSFLQAGQPVFSLVTPDLWVIANFKETQLTRMRHGQHVTITVDAYPSLSLSGHVDSVQMGSGSRFSAFPAENATGNYVKIVQRVPVKIVIDHGLDPKLPLPLGLSVDPTVDVK